MQTFFIQSNSPELIITHLLLVAQSRKICRLSGSHCCSWDCGHGVKSLVLWALFSNLCEHFKDN